MSVIQRSVRKNQLYGSGTQEWLVSFGTQPSLAAQGLHAVGWVAARQGYEFVFTDSPLALVFVCLEGIGEVLVRGKWHPCTAGMAYLAPAEVLRAYRFRAGDTGADAPEAAWLCAWALAHERSLMEVQEPTLVPADGRLLLSAIQGLYEEDHSRVPDVDMVEGYVRIIAGHARRLARPAASAYRGRLRKVWNRVLADLQHPWNVAELADDACLTEEGFRLLCHRETGDSPIAYVTRLRMRHAGFLLLTDYLSIAEIAESVGYSNQRAFFTTAFRRIMGATPTDYRARDAPGCSEPAPIRAPRDRAPLVCQVRDLPVPDTMESPENRKRAGVKSAKGLTALSRVIKSGPISQVCRLGLFRRQARRGRQ